MSSLITFIGRFWPGVPVRVMALTTVLFSLLACQNRPAAEIHDLIQPVVLTANQSDTLVISDLFYAETYPLAFGAHPEISLAYDQTSGQLILKPGADFEGFTLLRFQLNGQSYVIPVYSRMQQSHTFTFAPDKRPAGGVHLMGSFNDWNRSSLPMTDPDGDGSFEIQLALDPGRYFYQFFLNRAGTWDPKNPVKVDNGFGSFNSVLTIPPRHSEKAFLHVLGFEETDSTVVLKFRYERENQPAALQAAQVFGLIDNEKIPEQRIYLDGNRITVLVDKMRATHAVVRLTVTQGGQASNMQTVQLKDGRPVGAERAGWASWHDAVIYALMTDRFCDGDKSNSVPIEHDSLARVANYMGGDWQGILQKLNEGYFDSLGVNTLWISPVNDNPDQAYREWPPPHRYFTGYHGYWPIHPTQVEERFGDFDLLKKMVRTAHEHGMKVLLDFVSNHVHIEHPFFREHRDWFGSLELPDGRKNIRLWDQYRLTTWFEPFMPSFDYVGSDAALQAMTDNAVWWLKETGADGFRHDAVKHVPNRYWRTLTRKVKKEVALPEQRNLFQIGETFGSYKLIGSYVNNGQLDAQFNFNLYDVALSVFLAPEANFSILANELHKTFAVYGFNHLMGNLMDSHDKIRYMAYADGDLALNSSAAGEIAWTNPPQVDQVSSYEKARLYLAYILTIPGIPVLYYGDEIGMTGASDPDNRRMMRFGNELNQAEKSMRSRVSELVKIRRAHSALRYGDFQTLFADERCFLYLRSDMRERILVALNKSAEAQTVAVDLPEFYLAENARDLITGERLPISDHKLTIEIPGSRYELLKLE